MEISGLKFPQAEITIPVGSTVRWTNRDPVAHTVTSTDKVWESPLFGNGESFEWTFTTPGSFEYYCIPHPFMKGKIIVEARE